MRFLIFALLLITFAFPTMSRAQAQNPAADVVMVLPFENTSKPFRPEYNWVGESFADALAELLNKPGLVVVSSAERELAYHQLRLPETVIPSRATAIKLARQARASIIVIGNYSVTPPLNADPKQPAANSEIVADSRAELRQHLGLHERAPAGKHGVRVRPAIAKLETAVERKPLLHGTNLDQPRGRDRPIHHA